MSYTLLKLYGSHKRISSLRIAMSSIGTIGCIWRKVLTIRHRIRRRYEAIDIAHEAYKRSQPNT